MRRATVNFHKRWLRGKIESGHAGIQNSLQQVTNGVLRVPAAELSKTMHGLRGAGRMLLRASTSLALTSTCASI